MNHLLKSLVILLATAQATLAVVQLYGQCGGQGYTNTDTTCVAGSTCTFVNTYYYQCLPSATQQDTAALYGQCGGQGWTGPTKCTTGSTCVVANSYYSQCLPSSSTNGPTTTAATTKSSATTASTTTPTTKSTATTASTTTATTKPTATSASTTTTKWTITPMTTTTTTLATTPTSGSSSSGIAPIKSSIFPFGKFRYGRSYNTNDNNYADYDYITIWLGSNPTFNVYWEGAMAKACRDNNKLPIFYAYIIAFTARQQLGLQDCDVNPGYSLCTNGADFIRNNRQLLVNRYADYASNLAGILGANTSAVFLIEPDFWQYYGWNNTQKNGALSGTYMRQLLDSFAGAIKQSLPNALISWDISAWIGEQGMRTWWSFFQSANYINFVHTSGGQSHPELTTLLPNELDWRVVSSITQKRIIADCGYGVAGGVSYNCGAWSQTSNIDARNADGVIALTQDNVQFKPVYRTPIINSI